MAGIYIHVPFCRKKCHYCDFYRTTAIAQKSRYLDALLQETEQRRDYLAQETVQTVYWGGGTPSVLTAGETGSVLRHIKQCFSLVENPEITMEANPDDISESYLEQLKKEGVNRLSIGVQSLEDEDLQLMNRRHSAETAIRSVELAYRAGFKDISIDLIFGIPGQTSGKWKETLKKALQLPINHLSAYHLTYHKGTVFEKWLKNGMLQELSEEESINQFEMLMAITSKAGFEQYEISNFARNQAFSRHNSGYWQGKKYLGLGPSAHSYNGTSRSWNIANLITYITLVLSGNPAFSSENLSEKERLNDYIITGIRTKWGISLDRIRTEHGLEAAEKISRDGNKYKEQGLVKIDDGIITLTFRGILISDQITRDLIVE